MSFKMLSKKLNVNCFTRQSTGKNTVLKFFKRFCFFPQDCVIVFYKLNAEQTPTGENGLLSGVLMLFCLLKLSSPSGLFLLSGIIEGS